MLAPHVLVTRFSIRRQGWTDKISGHSEERRARWFAWRSALFKRTLYRSLLGQSHQDFRLFVLMDEGDEPLWEQHLAIADPRLTPIFEADPRLNLAGTREQLHRLASPGLLISRVDSDDLLAADYLLRINASAELLEKNGVGRGLILSPLGYVTDGAYVQRLYYPSAPFISLYCRAYNRENIYGFDHTKVLQIGVPCLLNPAAAWMQFLHGTNLVNRFRLERVVQPDRFQACVAESPRLMVALAPEPAASAWPPGFPFPIA
jgi:hypothetical protein